MKTILCFFILMFSLTKLSSQPTLDKVVGKYFRVNPLDRPFNVFMNQVIKDSAFSIITLQKRTDTSLFYLRGIYKNFNPFTFRTQIVQFIIADYLVVDDSTNQPVDTLISFRLTATTTPDAGKDQYKQVQNEYKVFNRKYRESFILNDEKTQLAPDNKTILGQVNDFFVHVPYYIPYFSVSWGNVFGKENYAFSLEMNLNIEDGELMLPIPPDRF
jgi:hypothetical protein